MKSAGYVAIIGGIMLFIGGASGWGIFAMIKEFVGPYLHVTGEYQGIVEGILQVLIILAALGGLTVIAGGYCILKEHERVGKILIIIGLGTGILSLLIGLIVALATDNLSSFTGSMLGLTGIGTLLSLAAKYMA